jgi:hypothetical protein
MSKVAVTCLAASTLTTQVDAVPVHAPDQPANAEPLFGVAVKVTLVPDAKLALQAEPQEMPAGLLVTGPLPAPALETVKAYEGTIRLNVAVTFLAALIVTTQVAAVLVQAPVHPANTDPLLGVAVSVTLAPEAKLALHAEPQAMPAGLLVTGPLPVPALAIVKV